MDNNNNNSMVVARQGMQGWVQPQVARPMPMFRMPGVAGNQTPEGAAGVQNFSMPRPGRLDYPENANAGMIGTPAQDLVDSMMSPIPCASPVFGGGFAVERADYNAIANYGYVRSALQAMDQLGRNDQDPQAGDDSATPGTYLIPVPLGPNFIIGFAIEWSLQLQAAATFSLEVVTSGWKNASLAPVDRSFSLRMANGGGGDNRSLISGGIFAFPFAQRLDATTSAGWVDSAAYAPNPRATQAKGGMNVAIAQCAKLLPYSTEGYVTSDAATLTVQNFVPGASYETLNDIPQLTVIVPAALSDYFSVTARPLTVAAPYTAMYRRALLLDTPPHD
jgi:hypothetical protein